VNDRGQLLSMLVALACLAAAWQHEGWAGFLALLPPLALLLGMIRYAGGISRAIGRGWGLRRAARPAPPAAIRLLGCVLLLVLLSFLVLRRLRGA